MKNIVTKIIIFTIIASMLISVAYPSQAKAADLVYTYWDLWYTLSSAANYSMQEKEGPFDGYDAAKLKDKAKAQFDDFKTWLQRAYMPVGITVDMLVNQADEMIANAKSTGLEMSQELWDAFRQYFDNMANGLSVKHNLTYNQYDDFIYEVTGIHFESIKLPQYNVKTFAILQELGTEDFYFVYDYYARIPLLEITPTCIKCKDLATGGYDQFAFIRSSATYTSYRRAVSEYTTSNSFKVLSIDGVVNEDISKEYSPFIDYTVTDACPQEVPEVIPWKVLPREITEEETKIKTNPPEDPDDDDKDKPAVIPPIHELPDPEGTEQESETEEDTEEETEETDTNKKPKPPKPEDMNDINLLADLTEIFPFCIPFDISRALKALKKESGTPPKFIIPFEMKNLGINEKVVIDFKDFEPLTKVIRSGVLVLYIIGLMWATSKVMKW